MHDEAPDNLCYHWGIGDKDGTDAAFKTRRARHRRCSFRNNRLIPNAIEPRAANASYDASDDSYTLYVANQNPHVERLLMCAFVLGIPEHKMRVVAPDVGGGFGSKIFLYGEETRAGLGQQADRAGRSSGPPSAAKRSCPTRTAATTSPRPSSALDKDGKFLALRVDTTANLGAYLSTFASAMPTILYATLLAGQYTTPKIYCEVTAVFTNTAPVDAYRGAGRPEATYVRRAHGRDRGAASCGIDPAEIRRRNFITRVPVRIAGRADLRHRRLRRDAEPGDRARPTWPASPARKAASEAKGLKRGIGYSAYIEACGIAPSSVAGALGARAGLFEAGEVRVHPTGKVTVFTGSHSHGQGHETTFAQVVADRLGIPHGRRRASSTATPARCCSAWAPTAALARRGRHGDRQGARQDHRQGQEDRRAPDGGGRHRRRCSKAAQFKVAGTDKAVPFAQVALTAYVPHNFPHDKLEPGLNENAFYDPSNFTYPAGTYICEVEVDPATGAVTHRPLHRGATTSATSSTR